MLAELRAKVQRELAEHERIGDEGNAWLESFKTRSGASERDESRIAELERLREQYRAALAEFREVVASMDEREARIERVSSR